MSEKVLIFVGCVGILAWAVVRFVAGTELPLLSLFAAGTLAFAGISGFLRERAGSGRLPTALQFEALAFAVAALGAGLVGAAFLIGLVGNQSPYEQIGGAGLIFTCLLTIAFLYYNRRLILTDGSGGDREERSNAPGESER